MRTPHRAQPPVWYIRGVLARPIYQTAVVAVPAARPFAQR